MALVNPDITNGEFDLQLTSGTTVIPLVMCDNSGNRNPLAFARNPVRRSSLKMYSDQQRYADLEPPWTPIAQTDWSGGKGSKDFDKDTGMYFDGYQVNTLRPGEIILGPKPNEISFGALESTSNTQGSNFDTFVTEETSIYYAFRFTAGATITVKEVSVIFSNAAFMTTGTLKIGLSAVGGDGKPSSPTYSDNSINAVSGIGFSTITCRFNFSAGYALTSGTNYFIIIRLTGMS